MISATSCYSSELLLDSFICPSVIRVPLVPLLASIQTICERILPRQQTNSLWKAEVTATLRITYQVSKKGWSCVSGTWSEVCGSCLNIVALKVSKSTMPQESSVLAGIWRWGSPEKKKKRQRNICLIPGIARGVLSHEIAAWGKLSHACLCSSPWGPQHPTVSLPCCHLENDIVCLTSGDTVGWNWGNVGR